MYEKRTMTYINLISISNGAKQQPCFLILCIFSFISNRKLLSILWQKPYLVKFFFLLSAYFIIENKQRNKGNKAQQIQLVVYSKTYIMKAAMRALKCLYLNGRKQTNKFKSKKQIACLSQKSTYNAG